MAKQRDGSPSRNKREAFLRDLINGNKLQHLPDGKQLQIVGALAMTTNDSNLHEFDINDIVKIGGSMQGHDSELQVRTGSCEEFSIHPNKIIQEPNSASIPITITKKKSKLDKNSIEYKIRKLDRKMCQTF